MGVTCWAACIGGCSTEQSREHYISKGIFGEGSIRVRGFHWCKHEAVEIGVGSATAKILCTAHNQQLSRLDAEAKHAFDCFRQVFALQRRQQELAPCRWMVRTWTINGRLLERWFIKTLANLTYIQNKDITWPGGGGPRSVPAELVRACFGHVPIPPPRGLHGAVSLGERIKSDDEVNFSPVMLPAPDQTVLAGGLFEFRGFRFLLSWTDQDLESSIDEVAGSVTAFQGANASQLLSPPKGIRLTVGNYLAQVVTFAWPSFRTR